MRNNLKEYPVWDCENCYYAMCPDTLFFYVNMENV